MVFFIYAREQIFASLCVYSLLYVSCLHFGSNCKMHPWLGGSDLKYFEYLGLYYANESRGIFYLCGKNHILSIWVYVDLFVFYLHFGSKCKMHMWLARVQFEIHNDTWVCIILIRTLTFFCLCLKNDIGVIM